MTEDHKPPPARTLRIAGALLLVLGLALAAAALLWPPGAPTPPAQAARADTGPKRDGR